MGTTTIQVQEETRDRLAKLRLIDREPLDAVIQRLLKEKRPA
jgi:predicted CopG family antitoxin